MEQESLRLCRTRAVYVDADSKLPPCPPLQRDILIDMALQLAGFECLAPDLALNGFQDCLFSILQNPTLQSLCCLFGRSFDLLDQRIRPMITHESIHPFTG